MDLSGKLLSLDAASLRLLLPLRIPGLPRIPRVLALVALRHPRWVPFWLRWHGASAGLGLVVARLTSHVREGGPDVGAVLEEIGREQGVAVRTQLGYGKTLLECAQTVALANRLFAIRARALSLHPGEAQVVTPGCPWSRREGWGAAPCGAFSRWEVGITAGLNPDVRLRYLAKRTRGDRQCVGSYTWRAE